MKFNLELQLFRLSPARINLIYGNELFFKVKTSRNPMYIFIQTVGSCCVIHPQTTGATFTCWHHAFISNAKFQLQKSSLWQSGKLVVHTKPGKEAFTSTDTREKKRILNGNIYKFD